ncbi:MAG: hypothetical protein H0U92_13300 [Actinobacteria bacterium]|nr:hypothetical protein [Actinomycetota bacterium]
MAAFVVSAELPDDVTIAALATQLLCSAEAPALSGAEFVVGHGWFGLRSHPRPSTSISFGGPALPPWLDDVLREAIGAR